MVGRDEGPDAGDTISDEALVERARRGDQECTRLLVRRYQRRIIGLAWGVVGNRADAEDVAQDAFLRAFRSLHTFGGRSSFRTWLFQIALNAARTWRRGRERRPEDGTGGPADLDDAPAAGSLEGAVVARDQVRRALATLPADLREAVVLRDVDGLDYREIATLLDVPIGTVESRIFRGRARLRAVLQNHEGAPRTRGGRSR